MQHSARSLLAGRIDRRAFVSRLVAAGFAAPAAASLSLQAQQAGRQVKGMTGGEVMAEFLLDWDVPYVFGLGGSEEVGFLDALVDRLGLHYVLALHEGSAMSMADGYARASGRTGFVNLHSVAGTGYALGPMVNAFKDRTPLVVTAGRQSTDVRGSEAFLEAVNLHTLPRDYTRWTWDVLTAQSIPETLRRAFLISRVPPGGPTFVTFSKDLWEVKLDSASILPPSRTPVEHEFLPSPEKISRAADLLVQAEFPLLIAGREISLHGGAGHLAEIAGLLGAPVMMDVPASHSPTGFPTTHPLFAGFFTMEPDFPPKFDLFASMGGTMFTLFNRPQQPLVDPKTTTIHASIDGAQIGRNYPVDLALAGNVGKTLEALAAELRRRSLSRTAVEQRRRLVEEFHQQRRQDLQQQAAQAWDQTPIAPERLAVELNRLLPA
ncbi:MAG: thiamine pyrophosphate-binding protein, partial [Acidobacteriota bacterium]